MRTLDWGLALTPDWFRDIDTGFDIVSVIVAVLIAATAFKFYTMTNENKYKWFSLSFLSVGVAYIFKSLTNIIVYHEQWGTQALGKYAVTVQYVHEYYYFEIFGTLAFRFFMLLGLFGLYYIICKSEDKKSIPIIVFLLFMTTIFSNVQYFAFHLTAALFLFFIVREYFKKDKSMRCIPCYAFAVLFISQVLFSLLFITPKMYVVAETVQLIGFLLLAYKYCTLVWKK